MLAEQLDIDSYAGSQAITIKLPLTHYEGLTNSNYERVDGEFQYEGVSYRLVKQKFYQDTAYIVAYKDERSIAIKSALEEYVDTFAGTPAEKKSESKTGFSFLKDYLHQHKISVHQPLIATTVKNNTSCVYHYQLLPDSAIDYPPELVG